MAKVNFGTLQAERNLRAAGISEEQAEMIVEEFKKAQEHLPNKSDFELLVGVLDSKLSNMGAELYKMNAELAKIESKLDAKLEKKMNHQTRWFVGTVIAVGILVAAVIALQPST